MFVTIINDCKDANAIGRQSTRASSLLGATATFVGVDKDIEAAGNIIDVLDAAEEQKGVVLVNVAPRNGDAKKWENGTPFCYFWCKNVLVVSSVDGLTLSLVKKLNLVTHVHLLDIPTVVKSLDGDVLDSETKTRIQETQFRSFEFVPRVAAWILEGKTIPAEEYSLQEVSDVPPSVWWVDNFGNAKTTILADEIKERGDVFGYPFYEHLADVPDEEVAAVSGSSGLEKRRFVEIVVQGGSAETQKSIKTGDIVDISGNL